MRVAITSTGNNLQSTIDPRFGRCAYFVIYDTETKATEFIPNPNIDVTDGAGGGIRAISCLAGYFKGCVGRVWHENQISVR